MNIPRCPICYDVIREPVVFLCRHEICRECFGKSLETANLCCPLCRKRVSSWARRNVKNPVDVKRMEEIQENLLAAEKENRVLDYCDEASEECLSGLSNRVLCEPGEIKKEYISELSVLRKEREEEDRLGEVEAWRLYHEEQKKTQQEIEREEQLGYLAAKALHDEEVEREKSQQQQVDEDEKMAELMSQEFILRSLESQQKQTLEDRKFAERLENLYERKGHNAASSPVSTHATKQPKRTPAKPSRKRAKQCSSKAKSCVSPSTKPITFWLKPSHLDEQ